MRHVLSDNIQVNAPKPIDNRYLNITVPYTSCSQVNTCLVAGVRYTGLTVNIAGVEYWYCGGILDSCLVSKSAGSTWGSITGTLSLQTDLQACLNGKLASGGTAICATSAIDSKALCGCIPASFLLSGGTAVCATSAIDSKGLCGCVPICFLGVNACASDSAKLGGVLPAGYMLTGSSSMSVFTITGNSTNTGFTISHNKNKTFVDVQIVKNTSPYPTIYTYISRPNANCVCVTFDTAPTTGQQYKIG